MTEAQRDYLADLAARKNVRLHGTDNWSAGFASAKIEELKSLPDAEFREITEEEEAHIDELTERCREELRQWTFTQ